MKSKLLVFLVFLVAAAGVTTWLIVGSNDKSESNNQSAQTQNNPEEHKPPATDRVADLVSYSLPAGWTETSCPNEEAQFLVPAGAPAANCEVSLSSPIKLYVDQNSTKDCSQLDNQANVKEHTCKSLFINDKKSLQSMTELNKTAGNGEDLTTDAYYIDTGKGVLAVEYVHSSDASYKTGFDQLAKSVQVK